MKFTFPPETRVLDGYTIKRAIYRGGFGEVYYALSDGGREVALKLLHNNTEVELRGVQQCLNLSHPNLVTIFDIRQDADGDHWIIMEYVGGETLDALIRRYPAGMPMELVRRWLPGIAAGVAFLHSRGIVHRDLKPANVFSDNGVVKVGDVGLSKFITPSRRSAQTQSVGTVYYMAPEVARGRYGKEVDVYALGIILYEMLTGHVPFAGESAAEVLLKHLTEAPDLSLLPPRIRPVIGRALAKDAVQRFPTVEAFVSAFDAAVLGRAADKSPEPFDPRQKPPLADPPPTVTAPLDGSPGRATPPPMRPETRPSPDAVVAAPFAERSVWDRMRPSLAGWWWIVGSGLLFVLGTRSTGDEAIMYFLNGILIGYLTYSAPRLFARREWGFERENRQNLAPTGARGVEPVGAMRPPPAPRRGGWAGPLHCQVHGPLTGRTRLAHWSTAAFASALITAALTTGVAGLAPSLFRIEAGSDVAPDAIALFGLTSIVAAWLATGVIKWTEAAVHRHRIEGHDGMRRLGLTAAGVLTGAAAWWIADFLQIDVGRLYAAQQVDGLFEAIGERPLIAIADGQRAPTLLGYIVFFGGLFGLRAWERQIELDRGARFRAASVMLTVLIAWLWAQVFAFPLTWALLWAAMISTTVQLAAPWSPGPRTDRPAT